MEYLYTLQISLLIFLSPQVLEVTCLTGIDSFLNVDKRHRNNQERILTPHASVKRSVIPTTIARKTSLFQERRQARRWNGSYKHASKKLSDIPKCKKLLFNVTANGVTKTLEKKRMETTEHVLTKAIIWKLFMNDYPNIKIEFDIGDPDYLPDVVSTTRTSSNQTETLFWGESGRMKAHKALDLMRRYPNMHIVHCRWGIDLDSFVRPFLEYLEAEIKEEDLINWKGRFSFASLPSEVWKFIDEDTRTIVIERRDLEWQELDLSQLVFNRSASNGGIR
mmetsp:Transcript_7138/g.17407  ORF Transcript_7138/g.17407 Transcript_7138/m.17407 type:complete len:278 (+) Transcript_7138:51-884(+)